MNALAETKALADQHAAGTTVRRITLADGTTIEHEVGELYWVDRILLTKNQNQGTN